MTIVKKRIMHNGFKLVVSCKVGDDGQLIPLKFDVFYNNTKVNWRLTWRQIKQFEEALYEHLNYKSQYN
jgi:hypothetical protein